MVGVIALGLLLVAQALIARLFTDGPIVEVWARLSEEAKVAYALLMLLYAAMPLLMARPTEAAPRPTRDPDRRSGQSPFGS